MKIGISLEAMKRDPPKLDRAEEGEGGLKVNRPHGG